MRLPGLPQGLLFLLLGLPVEAALACGAGSSGSGPSRADEAGISVSVGAFDFGKGQEAFEAGVEHRFRGDLCLGIGFHAGALVTADSSLYVYAGLDRRFELGGGWFLNPSLAAGHHEAGDGKDLGGALEFRSGIVLGRRLAGGSSLGLGFFHLSNSSYYRRNPGANSLVVRWSR